MCVCARAHTQTRSPFPLLVLSERRFFQQKARRCLENKLQKLRPISTFYSGKGGHSQKAQAASAPLGAWGARKQRKQRGRQAGTRARQAFQLATPGSFWLAQLAEGWTGSGLCQRHPSRGGGRAEEQGPHPGKEEKAAFLWHSGTHAPRGRQTPPLPRRACCVLGSLFCIPHTASSGQGRLVTRSPMDRHQHARTHSRIKAMRDAREKSQGLLTARGSPFPRKPAEAHTHTHTRLGLVLGDKVLRRRGSGCDKSQPMSSLIQRKGGGHHWAARRVVAPSKQGLPLPTRLGDPRSSHRGPVPAAPPEEAESMPAHVPREPVPGPD